MVNIGIFKFTRFEKLLMYVSVLAFAMYTVSSIVYSKALYADGAFFFIDAATKIFENRAKWWSDDYTHMRLLVNILCQLPLRVAIGLGVTDLAWLRVIFCAPLFLTYSICLIWIFLISRRATDFTYFVLAVGVYVLFVMPSDIFAVNPARVSMGFYWVLFTYLMVPVSLNKIDIVILSLLSLIIFRSHEGVIICGPIIFLGSCLSWVKSHPDRGAKLLFGIIALSAGFSGVLWQLTHVVSAATSSYLGLIMNLTPRDFTRTMFGFVWLPLFLIFRYCICFSSQKIYFRQTSRVFWLLLFGLIAFGVLPFFLPKFVQPSKEFTLRFLITSGGPLVMLAALWLSIRGEINRINLRALILILAFTLLGEVLWQTASLHNWNRVVASTRLALQRSSAPVISHDDVFESFNSADQFMLRRYGWAWAWPVFGLAFGSGRSVSTLIKPHDEMKFFLIPKEGEIVAHIPYLKLREGLFSFHEFRRRCAAHPIECYER
ncbi:MAG: hypothetical protein EOP06_05695 [Proteobacteria bacterium]|nr:MAG: hypothetical protein EOP06_05695 [Pseudomonadota bacterium]